MLFGRIKYLLFEVYLVASMNFFTIFRFRIWWYHRIGRGAEADARVQEGLEEWCQNVTRRLGFRVEVEGREHIPTGQPYVVMCNHQDKYDALLLLGYLSNSLGFVAKPELFRVPGLAYWMKQLHCIAVDRDNIHTGAKTLQTLGRGLHERQGGFIIFPEGSRTRDPKGKVQAFRPGSILLAMENQLPVLPVIFDGTRFMDNVKFLVTQPKERRVIRMRIEPLRPTSGLDGKARKAFMKDLRNTIISGWESIRTDWPVNS